MASLQKSLKKSSRHEVVTFSKKELNILDKKELQRVIKDVSPDVIINTAAYNKVDLAEDEVEKAFEVNYQGVVNLVDVANSNRIKLIHYSTDYVFDGMKNSPYCEEDKASPINQYGKSKLEGEKYALQYLKQGAVFRVSWVYSSHGANFVNKILELGRDNGHLKIVNDQIGTPTCTKDIVRATEIYLESNLESVELFNFSNEGKCSWYEFSIAIRDIKGEKFEIVPVKSSEFKTRALRPNYTVMSKDKFKKMFNYNIPDWKFSLENTLRNH
jgi:dTDP-4-dehydrorhamnose reductase